MKPLKTQKEVNEEMEKYINSKEHNYQCASWNEGLECCLGKEWLKSFLHLQRKEDVERIMEWVKDSKLRDFEDDYFAGDRGTELTIGIGFLTLKQGIINHLSNIQKDL